MRKSIIQSGLQLFPGSNRHGNAGVRLGRMMPFCNVPRIAMWRACHLLVAVTMLCVGSPAFAAPEASPGTAAPRVDWAVAKLAYAQIDQWVADESVNRKADDRPLMVTGVTGVKVTLRYGGLTVGSGESLVPSFNPDRKTDLHELAAKATGLALVQFKDQRGAGGKWKLEVDLQVAHTPETIELAANADSKTIYFQFAAGFHGLRMTHHKQKDSSAVMWPASAVASNMRPDSQINRLLANLGYKFNELQAIQARLGHPDGPALQRFQVIHLVRNPNAKDVNQLVRGGEIKSANAISMASVKSSSDRLFQYIERRISPEGSMPGTYQPTSDRYKPLKADVEDVAITLAALVERTRYLYDIAPNGLDYHRAKEQVRVLVISLRKSLVGANAKSKSPEAMAHLMTAIIDSPHLGELKLDRNWLGNQLQKIQDDKGRFIDPASKQPVKPHAQAMITSSLVKLYGQTREEALPAVIHKAQDQLWLKMDDTVDVITAQPWMADALVQMNKLLPPTDDAGKEKFAKRAEALKTLAESIRKKKLVRGTPSLGPADVVGGVDLINESDAGARTPDWRTSHVLALLAGQLNESAIIPEADRIMVQFDCTLLVRFLDQLTFDDAACFYVRSKTDAIHGVRFALWDNRLHVEPTAMTLLALTRLQAALTPKQTTSSN